MLNAKERELLLYLAKKERRREEQEMCYLGRQIERELERIRISEHERELLLCIIKQARERSEMEQDISDFGRRVFGSQIECELDKIKSNKRNNDVTFNNEEEEI